MSKGDTRRQRQSNNMEPAPSVPPLSPGAAAVERHTGGMHSGATLTMRSTRPRTQRKTRSCVGPGGVP